MKKLFIVMMALLFAGAASGAGTVTQDGAVNVNTGTRTLTFTCVGDSSNGSIPDTDTNDDNTAFIKGWRLYDVEVNPGTPAPDAADVLIKNAAGRDFLDSLGTNLVHATNTQSMGDSMPFFDVVDGVITLDVDNQGTASAQYTVKMTFK